MITQKRFGLFASLLVLAAIAAIVLTLSYIRPAQANPLGFSCPSYTATATTTLANLTAGAATTTIVYDTYCIGGTNQPNVGNTYVTNSLALLTQFTASSTLSILNANVEYSQDGIDWYQDNYLITGTGAVAIATPVSYTWTFATSTVGGVANTSNRIGKLIRIYPPTRYVRVVYSLTGTNGEIWASVLPVKERAN